MSPPSAKMFFKSRLRQQRQCRAVAWRWPLLAIAVCGCGLVGSFGQRLEAVDGPTEIPASSETALEETPIGDSDREHWSFRPLSMPAVPVNSGQSGQSENAAADGKPADGKPADDNPGQRVAKLAGGAQPLGAIDSFISVQLRKLGLDLAPEAEPGHLFRRLTLDLTGLPPAPDALARFEEQAAEAPDAYLRAVDRLLASPALGEHAAQSWLDLARFAETDGFEHDKVRPDAWRYRNWVIDALNNDLPYDQFMRLQVAGDLIDPAGGDVATMFCLAGPDMPDINDQQERRHNLLNEMTGTVGSVLLGLQLGCAACHDHKYDPLSQADFYRLRGVLETGVAELKRDKPWVMMQEQSDPPPAYLYQRGDHRRPSVVLTRSVPRIASAEPTVQAIAAADHPRLAFADWLSSDENPLPARTMANRLWQLHFGRGLAATPSDLGLVGIEPTHGELLDWLACQLKEGQWSLKRLRRQILLSATYRQASLPPAAEVTGAPALASQGEGGSTFALRLERDPENRAYSRYPRRRLTGEMLRDALLSTAGWLDRRAGGKSVMPPLPSELVSTLLPGQWKTSADPADHCRRSIYVFARRNLRYPIFETFDRPDAGASCPQRGQSVTATQSLLLLNSEFSLDIAAALADQALEHVDGANERASERVDQPGVDGVSHSPAAHSRQGRLAEFLWQRVLARRPTAMEYELLKSTLGESDQERRGLVTAALALLNCNEFVIID